MISTLLWQCLLCHVDDALKHQIHWFRPDQVQCSHCGTVWEVEGFSGGDYRLKIVRGDPSMCGQVRPLAEWYDLMKAGLRLVPRQELSIHLEAGEELYVRSREARLFVEEDNPLRRHWDREEVPWEKGDLGLSFTKRWDRGRLFLTSERFIWEGVRGRRTFHLTRVTSALIQTNILRLGHLFGLLYGLRRYQFQFRQESALKWLTYTGLMAKRIEQISGHQISLTSY